MVETTKISKLQIPSNSLFNLIKEFATLFKSKSFFKIYSKIFFIKLIPLVIISPLIFENS
jgi:hypothetical protein